MGTYSSRANTNQGEAMQIRTRQYRDGPGEWIAWDDDTYDGPGSTTGVGTTEGEAIDDLVERTTEPVECVAATPAEPNPPTKPETAEELAMLVAWIGTGLIYFLRHEGVGEQIDQNAARGLEYAGRLARAARGAASIFLARGGPELGGCDTCSDPQCYRNQTMACWPDEPDTDGEDL